MKSPRGIRNNNPLHIKIGNDWQGERPNTDGVFEEFITMSFGLRAAFIILRKYINKYERNTIRLIIHAWCPDGHLIESKYMYFVSMITSIGVDEVIRYEDKETMVRIVRAMAKFETGVTIPKQDIIAGYDMANA